ncbi:MAG: hypothetical protein ACXAC7_15770 [Candidatus Hodarchaeales archaeon]
MITCLHLFYNTTFSAIHIISTENSFLVEKIEGKYQAMIRKVITDESIPFEQRSLLSSNYLPSLFTREKLELERLQNQASVKRL